MIKPPFTAKSGLSGVWIEDANGLTIWSINSLLELGDEQLFDVAELFANGANFLLERRNHQRQMTVKAAQSPRTGRPRSKKPSPAALAKRKSRAKQKGD
jgi:hypothetical protein